MENLLDSSSNGGYVTNCSEPTPIEKVGDIYLKRDDKFIIAGVKGGKARTCWFLAQGAKGLVTAGSRQSPQINIVAHIAKYLGIPCRAHTPTGKLNPEVALAKQIGAEIIQHPQGYNTVIIARARADAERLNWTEIPFGMQCQEAVNQTMKQVKNVPRNTKRIVVTVGSGMSLAGVLYGLIKEELHIPVLGIKVGADPTKRLYAFAPLGWHNMVELIDSGVGYHVYAKETKLGNVELDPIYEAKCLKYLKPQDLFWVIGKR